MSLRIEPNAEPIPGYRLIERLGSGGFGEVWKAEAPGGLFKAIKFVQRETHPEDAVGDRDPSRAEQEWKSLVRVKSVRHPFILLLDRFENIQNFLVIVMELADRTLADRFKECRSQGLPGIPREELLGYLAEAAEVLDLMNSQYQLQHLDIKPQNLFLVHNHVKVADFGLVKDTTSGVKLMTITGGVTPVYAAPETFDGKFSRQCDQYSLAIVYQEMLTGHRPFSGSSMKQLILQHMQNAHDLTSMPVHDRPVIAQALSKNPEDRFATCVDLIAQLRRATLRLEPSAMPANPVSAAPPPALDSRALHSVSKTVGVRGRAGPVQPVEPNFSVGAAFLRESSAPSDSRRSESPSRSSTHTTSHCRPKKSAAPTPTPGGVVQPALIVGIGRLGIETLVQVRKRVATELGSGDALPHVRFVAIDTDAQTLQQATADPRAGLHAQDTMHARLQRPGQYLKPRDGKLPTESWLNTRLLHRIPREQQGGAGLRPLGRLAFVDNYRNIAKRLETELQIICSPDTLPNSASAHDLGLRTRRPRVYVLTSLTGNTGSGMFLDVAYLLRGLLENHGHDQAEIVGLFYLPGERREGAGGPLSNAYAALTELQYYCQPNAVFSAHCETSTSSGRGDRASRVGPAFQRCVLMALAEAPGKPADTDNSHVVARAGDFLYRDLATLLGQTIDAERTDKVQGSSADAGPLLQSIGMTRIHWPRLTLLDECSRRLCTQLVTRWMSKDAAPLAATISQWTAERWEAAGLRPEALIERFQTRAEQELQKKPDSMLAEILAVMQQQLGPDREPSKGKPTPVNMVPVVQAIDALERIMGLPEESRAARQVHAEPALLEHAFDDIARNIADECEQTLAELAVTLLEDPQYRLAGAEEALRQFGVTVEQALHAQETLAKELAEKSAQLQQRIQKMLDASGQTGQSTSTQWTMLTKRPSMPGFTAGEIFELIRTYAKTRYHSLVLTHLNRLYLGLRGHLSDQIREVGFCRTRLGELAGFLRPTPPTGRKDAAAAGERALFPPGCFELRDAIEQISQTITPDDLLAFDERAQALIQTQCRALVEVCMGSATIVKNLAPALLEEAHAFLAERLEGASVAEMYLTGKRREFDDTADDMIIDDLQRCLDDATPEVGRIAEGNEISIVTLPADEHGTELQKLLKQRLRNLKIMLTDRLDEMVFYHEIIRIRWTDLAQLGPIAFEAYHQRCQADPSSLHSREDVFEWQLIAESKR